MQKFKALAFASVLALSTSTALYAGQNNTGCGLGSVVFEGKDGLISQIAAITTNGISSNGTFGITLGTLNCQKFSALASNEKVNTFVANNMDNLAKDISKGNGEYLNTLAVLMEVKEPQRGQFYAKLQSNFDNIYTTDTVTHAEVLTNIEKTLN